MVRITSIAATMALLSSVLAMPSPLTPDPNGVPHIGNGAGQQFITGQCLSNADCASNCCATLPTASGTIGICSGPGASTQQGKQGCGFNSGAAAAAPAATTSAAAAVSTGAVTSTINQNIPGAANVGNGQGLQFITGQCLSDADCASGCCAKLKGAGQCSGPAVSFDAGKEGCGFVGVVA